MKTLKIQRNLVIKELNFGGDVELEYGRVITELYRGEWQAENLTWERTTSLASDHGFGQWKG